VKSRTVVRVLLGAAAAAAVGVGVRVANPRLISWWLVGGCTGAGGCLALATTRRGRWEERNMLIAAAGWLVTAALVSATIWPLVGTFALYVFYFVLYTRRHKRRHKTP